MFDATAAVLLTVVVVLTRLVSVFTGTGISVPDAIIAFLLLLVKTTGRLITRKRPVDSRTCTTVASALPAARYTFAPLAALVANWVKLTRLPGSKTLPPVVVAGAALVAGTGLPPPGNGGIPVKLVVPAIRRFARTK